MFGGTPNVQFYYPTPKFVKINSVVSISTLRIPVNSTTQFLAYGSSVACVAINLTTEETKESQEAYINVQGNLDIYC